MPLLNCFYWPKSARANARWCAIIGALMAVFALGGCSSVRLAYTNGPNLSLWWLDSYFDFDSVQSERMRTDLEDLQKWHRAQELPLLAETLKNLQTTAATSVSADQVCGLYDTLQARARVAADRMAAPLAQLAPTLQADQLAHIARQFDKRNREWREEWMDGTPQELAERRVDKMVERAESFYGRLEPAQITVVRTQLGLVEFDSAQYYRELLRRQQDALQTLRLSAGAAPSQVQADMAALIGRYFVSPDPAYRQYKARFMAQNCAAMAAMHNSTTQKQRQRLAQILKDYEADALALKAP